ncbi:MAG: cell division ATP-binding protein FtsE [Muribaculaceae bacterium]
MALIDYKNVEVRRKEHLVLKDVTFSIDCGELVYLVGRVGSGKSSLLKTMYAEVPVVSGDADVLGYNLTSIRRRDIPYLRRRLGIVFQDFQLLTDRNVYANLEFVLDATGMKNASERNDRIDDVLHQVGMNQKSYKMPHELSGGEQQRIVIARALLNNPEVILADEPTGNLDPETGEQIFYLLSEIARQGTSVIIATHNHAMIDRYPGRVFICEQQRLSELP